MVATVAERNVWQAVFSECYMHSPMQAASVHVPWADVHCTALGRTPRKKRTGGGWTRTVPQRELPQIMAFGVPYQSEEQHMFVFGQHELQSMACIEQ